MAGKDANFSGVRTHARRYPQGGPHDPQGGPQAPTDSLARTTCFAMSSRRSRDRRGRSELGRIAPAYTRVFFPISAALSSVLGYLVDVVGNEAVCFTMHS